MKIKELIEELKTLPPEANIYVACDEELNTIFSKFEIGDCGSNNFVFYGLSTTEFTDEEILEW